MNGSKILKSKPFFIHSKSSQAYTHAHTKVCEWVQRQTIIRKKMDTEKERNKLDSMKPLWCRWMLLLCVVHLCLSGYSSESNMLHIIVLAIRNCHSAGMHVHSSASWWKKKKLIREKHNTNIFVIVGSTFSQCLNTISYTLHGLLFHFISFHIFRALSSSSTLCIKL